MFYHCENKDCQFTFQAEGEMTCCPDCGWKDIHPATDAEIMEYWHNHKEQELKHA